MPRKIDYEEVEWDRANCRGVQTDFFYLEEEFLKIKSLNTRQVRRICFRCPIRQQCLEVGFAQERYGMWGGVASAERNEIIAQRHDSRLLSPLKRDLEEFGVPYAEIVEASDVERKLL